MAQTASETEFTLDTAAELAAAEPAAAIRGRSPWYLAWRRLRRNYVAFAFLGLFVIIVAACALAPVYAKHVAHSGPNTNHGRMRWYAHCVGPPQKVALPKKLQ